VTERQLHLNAFLMGVGHHEAAWRHPRTDPKALDDVAHFQHLAQIAEHGTFDSVFLADGVQIWGDVRHTAAGRFEPLTLLTALSQVTDHIGLIATASTGFSEPYNLARLFSSLDHISGGRAGWNAVTTSYASTGANFGVQHPVHADRYAIAEEFIDVVRGLWDSWDDGAFPKDKSTGTFVDQSKRHVLDHKGQFFSVKGPLNTSRPPQGHPIIVQSGSSVPGQELAARTGDVVFTAHQTLESAQAFYRELKGRLPRYGRRSEDLAIMPGFLPVLGGTEKEARDKLAQLDSWTDQSKVIGMLSDRLGHDISKYDLDGPLPELPVSEQIQSRARLLTDAARRDNLTLRQLAQMVATGRGHFVMCGTPEQIAARMEAWFVAGGADGFNVMPPYFPGGLDDFAAGVIPILQKRGLFRTEYEGTTLRDHFGLSRPPNRHRSPAPRGAGAFA
jgi:FMN-dependent oxidoreductase (nitrilotriacetate monooxygenase family)